MEQIKIVHNLIGQTLFSNAKKHAGMKVFHAKHINGWKLPNNAQLSKIHIIV